MVKKLNLMAEIPPSRELHIKLPKDVPIGPAEIVLVVSSSTRPSDSTLGALAGSDLFGLWKDRPDVTDSFAESLRSEGWKHSA
jgi:hypothetical protein